jgi:hypothetical protein
MLLCYSRDICFGAQGRRQREQRELRIDAVGAADSVTPRQEWRPFAGLVFRFCERRAAGHV